MAFLQGFVKQGIKRLLPEVQQVELVGVQKLVG